MYEMRLMNFKDLLYNSFQLLTNLFLIPLIINYLKRFEDILVVSLVDQL